jgi:hypothetical protein
MEGRRQPRELSPEAKAMRAASQEARGKGTEAQREASIEASQILNEDEPTDEQELAVENKENEADALLDQWVDYLTNPDVNMMSEAGKVLVDVQKLYDMGLTEKSLGDIRKKTAARNAPVKRDVYGQAGQGKAA